MIPALPKAALQKIQLEPLKAAGIELFVLREDLSHPFLSGNKWRKLKYNLTEFRSSEKKAILTFGGKYSNHLVASAAAGKLFKIPMIGILRGEEYVNNPNLTFLQECGMKLLSIRRDEYRKRDDDIFLNELYKRCLEQFPDILADIRDIYMIPEGGANYAGLKGCMEIMDDIPTDTSHICVACGTGSTLAGIANKLSASQRAIGIAVLRGENFLLNSVIKQGADPGRTEIIFDYHFGAYAKTTAALKKFCVDFSAAHSIPLEPVYTGKLFYAIIDLLAKNYFPKHSKIVLVHSGGIFDFSKKLKPFESA